MTRGSTIALALGLSGFIAGGSIASMALFSSKRAAPSTHIIIAEPASITMGPAAALPTATFIDFTSEPAIRSPKGGFLVKIPADKFELDFKTATLDEDAEGGVPLPRRKPSAGIKLASTVAGLEAFSSREETITLQPVKNYGNWPKDAVGGAREKCERLLRGLDVKFTAKDPIGSPRGCGIAYPLSVSAIAGVAITPAATLNCEMVAALHGWITQVAQPTAKQEFNTRLTGLQNASSYACRKRNNSSSGKLSEHALGNALDIADFRFSNRMEASVAGSWSGSIKGLSLGSRGDFMKRTRAGACKHFNTVLGPGSDAFHKDHFHLDLMKLRTGRGKYCR